MANRKVLEEMLRSEKIDGKEFKKLCFQGIPDGCGLRSTCWKILLNYIPYSTKEWDTILTKQRAVYSQFIKTMIINPNEVNSGSSDIDHPLSSGPDSSWSEYFKENEVLSQIDKDVRRLCPDLSFFQQPTNYPASFCSQNLRTRVEQANLQAMQVTKSKSGGSLLASTRKRHVSDDGYYKILPEGEEAHWEVCERILFIFALLNPGIAYVQGMNEVLGPIYYTFVTDSKDSEVNAEADAFFCFTGIMSEIKDNFIKILDFSQCGISHNMNKLMELLQLCDPQLHACLTERNIKPQFFSFRWITLLLSQDFLYPEIQRLWDSLFSDEHRFKFLLYFCCAMMVAQRTRLILGDFIDNMKVLQKYPIETDIYQLLQLACQIRDDKLILQPVNTNPENDYKPSNQPNVSKLFGGFLSKVKNR